MIGLGIVLLFVTLGACIKYGKMYFLIAGYNTMSKEEKADYDIKGIASLFWNGMIGMSLLIVMGELVALVLEDQKISLYAIVIAVVVGVLYLIIKSNSSTFKRKKQV
jgi:6-phosphogluconate dehydrogenase (decarboxylating)